MNLVATIWVGIITVIFCLPFTPAGVPWNDEFDWSSVNYAPLTVGGLILAVGIWWLVSARHSSPARCATSSSRARAWASPTTSPTKV